MNRKNITIKDISIKAGVSIRTVSRVLNKSVYVNESTRLNVLKIIEELNYKPNLLAQKLKNNRSGTIGYIIPDFKNQFFGIVFNGIEKELKKFNYNILVVNSNGKVDLEKIV